VALMQRRWQVLPLLAVLALAGLFAWHHGRSSAEPDHPTLEKTLPATQAAGIAPANSAAVPADPGRAEAEAALARVRDTGLPLEERQKELIEISRRKDAAALGILRAVGDARVYLNHAAVEAVGNLEESPEKPAACAYLQSKLSDADSQIACAAIRGYTRLMGDAAVQELAAVLRNNRARPDGHQELVCTAAVKALQDICSPAAVPALIAELARSGERGWSLEYGSTIVSALRRIQAPEGGAAVLAYADRLQARRPADPLAGRYYDEKIAEARGGAGAGARKELDPSRER
jgi:hypothetical protein